MAKKKKLETRAPVPLTRGQISRAQREQRQIRNLYTAGIALATLVLLLFGAAALNTFVLGPNKEVARVNDKVITRATYDKMRRYNIFQSMQNQALQQQLGQQAGTSGQTLVTLQQQLRNVDRETSLDPDVVGQLVDAEVLRQQSSKEFQINPTQDELKASAMKDFLPQPTPPVTPNPPSTPSVVVTGTTTVTPVTPTLTPSATRGSPTVTPTSSATLPPVPGAQQTAESFYARFAKSISLSTGPHPNDGICGAGCPNLSEADYLGLVIDPRLRREKVVDKLSATQVMTAVEQIHAQHILTATEEGAKSLIARLDKGEDFTTLANTQSSEQINNEKNGTQPNGGDLGWFPKQGSNLIQEFVDPAFAVPTGKYSQPVKTQFGWHIIKVLERDPKRPLEQAQIDTAKNKAYDDWFKKAKESMTIVPVPTTTPVVPTQPAIVNPTAPPAPTAIPGSPAATDNTPIPPVVQSPQATQQGTSSPGITPSGSPSAGSNPTTGSSATGTVTP